MNTITFLVVTGILASTVQALSYICSKDAQNNEMTVTIRQEKGPAAAQLEAIQIPTGKTDDCTSIETTSGTSTILELVITVSISTRLQTSPTIATSDCFVEPDGSVATKVKINIVQQAFAGLSVSTDTVHTVSCDSSTVGSPVIQLSGGQALTASLTPLTVAALTDGVLVKLILDSDGSVITSAQDLGTLVKIKITYTFPTSGGPAIPVGIFTHSVIAAGTADFSGPTAELITPNGCLSTSAMAAPFALTDSMTYDSAASATAATAAAAATAGNSANVYVSGKFKLAMFDGPAPKNLYIKLQYEAACLTTTEDKCANQQKYCNDNGLHRRRRSADDVFAPNGTITFVLPLKVGNGAISAGYGSGLAGYGSGAFIAQPECRVPELYWIISVVLGVMLLIVMALCVFLAFRLRKERGSVDKFFEKQGQTNPVYS